MKLCYGLLVAFALVVTWLGWTILNLAIENDGLRQVAEGHRSSVKALLSYASIATRCNVTPQELASNLKTMVQSTSVDGATSEVAHLAFKAQFDKRGLTQVEIVDIGKVAVCQVR